MRAACGSGAGNINTEEADHIYDLIEGYEQGRAIEPELWDEKIIDSINYLILLRAVLCEEEKENADTKLHD